MEKEILKQILLEIREMRTSTNEKFKGIDQRFEEIDQRFEKIDQRFDEMKDYIDQRFDEMSKEVGQELRDFADVIEKRQNKIFQKLYKKIDTTNKELKEHKNNVIKGLQQLEKAVS